MPRQMRRLFLEPDEIGVWLRPHGVHEEWQDLGLGLLVTLAQGAGFPFDTLSLKSLHSWAEWRSVARSYDLICMNVRSWRFPWAKRAAEIAKATNPNILVWVGGIHTSAALPEMEAVPQFDMIVKGYGEAAFPCMLKVLTITGGRKVQNNLLFESRTVRFGDRIELDSLPFIDREIMPRGTVSWPLEGPAGWAEGKTATIITGRGCPYRCAFCASERAHFGPPRRRSVDNVLEELNWIDGKWGPIGSVVFHDSLFLMNRPWLEEFAEKYPRKTMGWPFWASARPDLIRKWPELFSALVEDAGWRAVSVGFESGSDNVLRILGKGTTVEDNEFAIELINRVGDSMEARGQMRPLVYANFMLAIPGETEDDARATVAMSRTIRNAIPGLSLYTPYPGTSLGDRIRAEGNAIGEPGAFSEVRPKVRGIDYAFYERLLAQ